jgi:hypothetical protein
MVGSAAAKNSLVTKADPGSCLSSKRGYEFGPIQTRANIGSQRYVVQKVLMQSSSHCNIATSPQPRKPSHTIITATISTARTPIANFLLACADDNRDLLEGVCNSTRGLADRCRSFICCCRFLISDK